MTSTQRAPDADAPDPAVGRRVWRLFTPYRSQLVAIVAVVLVTAGLGVIPPFLTQAVFDQALFPVDGGDVDVTLLVGLVAALVLLPMLTALIGVGQTFLTTRLGQQVTADLRSRLFEHLQRMELAFFTATRTGSIQSRLANDVGGVSNVLSTTASSILSNSVTVIAAFTAMILLSWQLTIVSVALMPLFVLLQIRVGRIRQRIAKRTQESLSEMTAITEESLSVSGVLLAKVFNRQQTEIDRYRQENGRQIGLQVRQAMTGQWFFAVVQAFLGVTPALVYLLGGIILVTGGSITAGTLVAFTTLQARLLFPTVQLLQVSLDVQTSFALFRRIFEYLDLTPRVVDSQAAAALPADGSGEIRFDDVWFRYPSDAGLPTSTEPVAARYAGNPAPAPEPAAEADRGPADEPWALRGISLTVQPGQLCAVVGPSGSGKTTMSYLVPRLYDATQGRVLVDGHDVRDVTMSSLADVVGMVTQDTYLFHATVLDNLRYANESATREDIEEAARAANIHERIMSFEDGYDTVVGERGYRLSGGEKQRLAIARVLLKDPRILILDEATSALDTVSERLVQEALERATTRRTTIAIAHRLSTVLNADVICVVDTGRLVESGTHDELLALDGLYARLYAEQFGQGAIEARCADGTTFADGSVLRHYPSPHHDRRGRDGGDGRPDSGDDGRDEPWRERATALSGVGPPGT